ncbi:amyloid beta precursor protein binding family B member 2-like isoform X2 [Liolophura sinensis]|uniref:amyloid beta precursor protein binding family B member 2-like isoform X2 n=1 Tax=Liolophura sinensis TaxID=3198878 RepID=UPI0031598CA4
MSNMAQSPVDNGDTTFTSFSNPNYGLEDRLNSNYSSQQYCDSNVYEDLKSPLLIHTDNLDNVDIKGSAKTQRKKYAELDLSSMGLTSSPDSGSSSGTSTIHSPDEGENLLPGPPQNNQGNSAQYLEFDGTYATVSNFGFPSDDVSNNTAASDVAPNSEDAATKSRGFLGYYSMLEAKAREMSSDLKSPDEEYVEADHGETTPSSTASSKPERFDDNTEINSPDSNDSGIQSDARSDDSGPAHIRAPSSDDLYAVVSKPKKKPEEDRTPTEDFTCTDDLYSVVNKPKKKTQPDPSAEEDFTCTDDLYSVVNKPKKKTHPDPSAEEDFTCTDDLYSVVNKPKKKTQPDPFAEEIYSSIDDVYAVVSKPKKQNGETNTHTETPCQDSAPHEEAEALPPGWEKHQDEQGAYFWHIKSGTIQREPPQPTSGASHPKDTKRSISSNSDESTLSVTSSPPSSPTSVLSATEEHLTQFEGHALKYVASSLKNLTSSNTNSAPEPTEKVEEAPGEKPIRFAVRSLGWVRIDEDDLTPERSSKAVNKCIVDLSLGRNDINDVVGRWGDGKDLFMDLDTSSLRLVDPQDCTLLNSQPIHSIRVWGVGRDNGRDFAYVARDKSTRKHMCHVFRCDTPARQIANTLRDICKKIMMERSLLEQGRSLQRMTRPTDLPNLEKNGQPNGQKLTFQNLYNNAQFPTPMEEPKKVIRCHYLGMHQVDKATGMDTLNNAIENLYNRVPPEKWLFASVAVAPSTITISEHSNPDNKVDECRVRFLSFMGIAMKNVKLCAFIMHTAQDQFFAHVFHCEPSAGPLCKTIEAACKLRYQKCLDAHPQTPDHIKKQQGKPGLGATLKAEVKAKMQNVVSLLRGGGHKNKQTDTTEQSNSESREDLS